MRIRDLGSIFKVLCISKASKIKVGKAFPTFPTCPPVRSGNSAQSHTGMQILILGIIIRQIYFKVDFELYWYGNLIHLGIISLLFSERYGHPCP